VSEAGEGVGGVWLVVSVFRDHDGVGRVAFGDDALGGWMMCLGRAFCSWLMGWL